ncbi:hypothetical protein Lal_00004483 [Lupinus albus]|nr:hypothetical protein Lal_00004483 [Lupinus albus]
MAKFLMHTQVLAAFFAIILLVASGHSESEGGKGQPKQKHKCWVISKTWPHARCFHSTICSTHCQKIDNAISGQCAFFFKKCQCKFCDE